MRKRKEPRPKGALSDAAYTQANVSLDTLCDRVVNNMTNLEHSPGEIITWMFDKPVLDTMRDAFKLANAGMKYYSGTVEYPVCPSVRMLIKNSAWNGVKCLSPDPSFFRAHSCQEPLLTYITSVCEIHDQFAVARYVLNWFQRNATAGALRHYWPSVLSLLDPNDHEELGNGGGFREPNFLGVQLPLIRASAVTIASGLMIRTDPVERELKGLTFKFMDQNIICNNLNVPVYAKNVYI
jgi:hypothetical protein